MKDLGEEEMARLTRDFERVLRRQLPDVDDHEALAEAAVRAVRMEIWSRELASTEPVAVPFVNGNRGTTGRSDAQHRV